MAATSSLTVVEHFGHEIVRVEGHRCHHRQAEEPQGPPQPFERVRQCQYCRPHYRRRQMIPRVPPFPYTKIIYIFFIIIYLFINHFENVKEFADKEWGGGRTWHLLIGG